MPLSKDDKEDLETRLRVNWRVDDGIYTAIIEDINIMHVSENRKPLCWDLRIDEQRVLQKLHWIDKKGGTEMLMNDLKNLGIVDSVENIFSRIQRLIGIRVKINVRFDGEYQNISFIGRA